MVIANFVNPFLFPVEEGALVGAWKELARTKLVSSGDLITVGSLPNVKHFMTLCHQKVTGGVVSLNFRFNADAVSNYAGTRSFDDGADSSFTNATEVDEGFGGTFQKFDVGFLTNILNKEIMQQHNFVYQDTAASSTDPRRAEIIGKWDNLVDPVDEIAAFNDSAGSFDTDAELVVLGWDESNTHSTTDSFWQQMGYTEITGTDTDMIVTFTAKKYIWFQIFLKQISGTMIPRIQFNGDVATNYAFTNNLNGSADVPATTQAYIQVNGSATSDDRVIDLYLLNTATDLKLLHSIDVHMNTAGTTPQRTETNGKWVETTDQVTQMKIFTGGTSDFGEGSYIQVWGAD